jgi:murein tripeptide amidase MpaA
MRSVDHGRDLLRSVDVFVTPAVNPDGANYTFNDSGNCLSGTYAGTGELSCAARVYADSGRFGAGRRRSATRMS